LAYKVGYCRTTTFVPTETRAYKSITSSFVSRKHPAKTAVPIVCGARSCARGIRGKSVVGRIVPADGTKAANWKNRRLRYISVFGQLSDKRRLEPHATVHWVGVK